MTLEQMHEVILKFCTSRVENLPDIPCFEDCPIDDLCEFVAGDFIHNPKECRAAYEIIKGLTLTPDKTAEPVKDNVNHPSHYETGKFECIEVMREALGEDVVKGFCLGNAFKYLYRCNHTHQNPLEDVRKAIWYLDKFVDLEGE